ncbi:uncharacterized protein LOC126907275 [Daktulosphaira vitifoliae]|uniref:uncharacterized protein LOC126907275 n=1 Tax=Daktulosphaira vitifoliae TaxID=58002 RepID=UPI0021AAB89E|nr:uncharacterized protein LOC126907275 [Daktulosphaira vitifoliae]
MYSGIFIFAFLSQLSFRFLSTMTYEKENYVTYLTGVVNYIRYKEGWNYLKHLELKLGSFDGIPVEEVLENNASNNLLEMSTFIINLLNNLYVEVIRSFLEFLRIIINKCEKYSADNLFKELIDCTELLENGVKKSTILFDKLYKATTFISSLDLKYAFPKIEGNPFVVVDEIYFVKQFVSFIILTNWSYYKNQKEDFDNYIAVMIISNIKKFSNEVTEMILNIEKGKKILVDFPYRINIKLMFDNGYKTCTNQYTRYNDFIFLNLNKVYDHIARNGFDKFGFNELLSPSINNFPSLVPPPDDPINPGQRLAAMNILIDKIKWDSFTGISIQESYQTISLSRVLRDPVDIYNFHIKRKYIKLLFRCKILEVLTEYTSYLTAILQLFDKEKKHLEFTNNHVKYVESVYIFVDTIKRTQIFFNIINTVIMNLNKSSMWFQNQASLLLWPIQKLVNDYFVLLNKTSLLRDDFIFKENCDEKIKADQYLSDVTLVKKLFSHKLCNLKRNREHRCIFNLSSRFHRENFKNITKINAVELNNNTIDSKTYCQQACVELYMYCDHFINVELINLGFDKIY